MAPTSPLQSLNFMIRLSLVKERLAALRRRLLGSPSAPLPGVTLDEALPWLESETGFPRLRLEAHPLVTVIIPAHGELPMTLRCLHAIARAEAGLPFEVIVVDDASEPSLSDALAAVSGLRVIRLTEHQGFVGAVNRGAEAARGSALLFLNNDTFVCSGWIDALQARLSRRGVGMVGGLLVSPDGGVQEAGGIIWRDGSATNYGRGRHPDDPAVSHVREVDYCSGACLMIEKDLFRDLGGFDVAFAPGYYEDVDLAFKVRQAGLRVEYEPRARVYHVEGGTAGLDTEVGMKRFQTRNRELFVESWREELGAQPRRETSADEAREHGLRKGCLVVDRQMPTPGRDAGSERLVRMLVELRRIGWRVTFAAYDLEDRADQRRTLEAMGIEVLRSPHVQSLARYVREQGRAFDCVILARVGVARRLIGPVRKHCPGASVIFDTVDLRSLRQSREAELTGDAKGQKAAEQSRKHELAVVGEVDATLVTSPVERDYLSRQDRTATITVVPTYYQSVRPVMQFERRSGALFVGGFRHRPNLDGILWFLDEILPRVQLLVAGFQVHIVGEQPPQELTRRASSEVHVHGQVPDLTSLFEQVRMSIAPLRFGAGLKGKVHHSLARGLPCVATPVAAEGLGLMPNLHAVLAERPSDFAEGMARLNSDRDLWQRVSIEGRAHVEHYFSDSAFSAGLGAALSARRPE